MGWVLLMGVGLGALLAKAWTRAAAWRAHRLALRRIAEQWGCESPEEVVERFRRPLPVDTRAGFEQRVRKLALPMIGNHGFIDFEWVEWATVTINVHVSVFRRWPTDKKWEAFEREVHAIKAVMMTVTINRRLTRAGGMEGRRA